MRIRHRMALKAGEPIHSKSQIRRDSYPTHLEANLGNMDSVQNCSIGLFAWKLGGYRIQGYFCVNRSDTIGDGCFTCGRGDCGRASGFTCPKCLDWGDGQSFLNWLWRWLALFLFINLAYKFRDKIDLKISLQGVCLSKQRSYPFLVPSSYCRANLIRLKHGDFTYKIEVSG